MMGKEQGAGSREQRARLRSLESWGQGPESRVQDFRSEVQKSSKSKVQGAGSEVHTSPESKVQSPRSKVQSLTFQASSLKPQASSLKGALSPFRPFALSLFSFLFVTCTLFSVPFLSACGHKTAVRPPEWASPEAIGDLALDIDNKKNVVVLKWGRPQEYTDGSDMDDLGGFVVLRATDERQGKESGFTQVATITVEDRDRFRKAKIFRYTDTQLTAGILYRYRVQAVTLDGYSSGLSNTVELVWKGGTVEAPAPVRVPAKR